jgi:hypothetical protein
LLDGNPIVVVATGLARASKNPKTGAEVQVYILADNGMDPIRAAKSGGDASICGDCPHRARPDGRLGSCYVNLIFGPLEVYKTLTSGGYPRFNRRRHLRLFRGRVIRLGAYGDPAAVPIGVWDDITSVAAHWTGYTHQWRTCDKAYARYCMASVETVTQMHEAWALGYRTFRVRLADQPVQQGEFICPASEEAGKRLSCVECKACSGAKASSRASSPVIIVHGSEAGGSWKHKLYRQTMERILAQETEQGQKRRFSLPVLN